MKRFCKAISFLAMITLMVAIFIFSSQDGELSREVSNSFVKRTSNVIVLKELFAVLPVRKLAHFTIYFCLGFTTFWFAKCFQLKYHCLLSIAFCFLYACTDEIHQYFVDGRGASAFDVCLDTFGSAVSIIPCCLLASFLAWVINKVRKKGH